LDNTHKHVTIHIHIDCMQSHNFTHHLLMQVHAYAELRQLDVLLGTLIASLFATDHDCSNQGSAAAAAAAAAAALVSTAGRECTGYTPRLKNSTHTCIQSTPLQS